MSDSLDITPATPVGTGTAEKQPSRWRRLRRQCRTVAAAMLALMTILALVAWPITFWRQVTYQFRAFTPNHPDDPLVRQYRNISSWPDDDIVEPDFRMIAVISRGTFGVTLHHIRITSPFEYVLTPVGNLTHRGGPSAQQSRFEFP